MHSHVKRIIFNDKSILKKHFGVQNRVENYNVYYID